MLQLKEIAGTENQKIRDWEAERGPATQFAVPLRGCQALEPFIGLNVTPVAGADRWHSLIGRARKMKLEN